MVMSALMFSGWLRNFPFLPLPFILKEADSSSVELAGVPIPESWASSRFIS